MGISEKVAFLKGLLEGSDLQLDEKTKKIVDLCVEILSDISTAIRDIDEDVETLFDGIDDICTDLEAMDEDIDKLFGEEGGCHCADCGEDEETIYQVECPNCSESFNVDEETIFSGSMECPKCGEKIEFELEEDSDGEDEENED